MPETIEQTTVQNTQEISQEASQKISQKITFVDDSRFEDDMNSTVRPLMLATRTSGWMDAPSHEGLRDLVGAYAPAVSHNNQLYYDYYDLDAFRAAGGVSVERPEKDRPSVVLVHGFTECAPKYQEMAYYFLQTGCDVWVMEHRGHGFSPHDTEDSSVVYIDDWRRYVADLVTFMGTIVKPQSHGPVYVYGHSMGGGISIGVAEQYPELAINMCSAALWLAQTQEFQRLLLGALPKLHALLG